MVGDTSGWDLLYFIFFYFPLICLFCCRDIRNRFWHGEGDVYEFVGSTYSKYNAFNFMLKCKGGGAAAMSMIYMPIGLHSTA